LLGAEFTKIWAEKHGSKQDHRAGTEAATQLRMAG
jgi:hypothetical protein